MSASEAQILANRRNSLKSTGPKTAEGKATSRANALKHGLCSSVVLAEDVELVHSRELDWYHALKPQNTAQAWLCDKVALCTVRIDRCERIERRLRDRKSMLSEIAWDDDQWSEAEVLGGKIRRKPAEVAEELRRTPAGCDWLMKRWAMLAETLELVGPWKADQLALAFDLLGTPLEFREGRSPGNLADQAALCHREVEILLERREAVTDRDEVDRALTEADLFDESHPELKRLRRYESALHTRLRWCMTQFQYESPNHRPHPDLRPSRIVEAEDKSDAKPEPAPAAVPLKVAAEGKKDQWPKPFKSWMAKPFQPPFDLRPHEIPADGSTPNIQAIAVAREVQRLEKAEAQRVARRRKLERLRA